jgi:hypothetical protein
VEGVWAAAGLILEACQHPASCQKVLRENSCCEIGIQFFQHPIRHVQPVREQLWQQRGESEGFLEVEMVMDEMLNPRVVAFVHGP